MIYSQEQFFHVEMAVGEPARYHELDNIPLTAICRRYVARSVFESTDELCWYLDYPLQLHQSWSIYALLRQLQRLLTFD